MSKEEPNKGTQMDLPGLEENPTVEPVVEPVVKSVSQPVEYEPYCPQCEITGDCGRDTCKQSQERRATV